MEDVTLITIGSDRGLADQTRAVWKRAESYARFCKHSYIVVFSLLSHGVPAQVSGDHLDVYFTRSLFRLLYIWDAYKRARAIIKQTEGRIVVSVQDPFESGVVGFLLTLRFRLPLHVQTHTDIGSPYFRKSSFLNKIRLLLLRFVLKKATVVRVVSPRIKQYIKDHYAIAEERIVVLPIFNTFVPEHRYTPERPYVLVVSRLETEKSVADALRAFAYAIHDNALVNLKIAGSGREEESLRKLSDELGISDRVEFLGHVHNTAHLYAGASCLLHTAQYEGFGLVLYEAMKAGCPIVTTDVGIAPEIKACYKPTTVCRVGDIACLAQHTQQFLEQTSAPHMPGELMFVPHGEEEYLAQYRTSLLMVLSE